MKRALSAFFLSIVMLTWAVAPGCALFKQNQNISAEGKRFVAFKDVWDVSRAAYLEFCKRVVQGKVSKQNEARADAAWNLFRQQYANAYRAANLSDTAPAPDSLKTSSSELVKLLTTL